MELSKQENLEQLISKWNQASWYYYNTDTTMMSDEEFDNLTQYLIENGIDLSQVGAPISSSNDKKIHRLRMRSLGKVKVSQAPENEKEFSDYYKEAVVNKLKRYNVDINSDTDILVSWKYDGCAIDIEYVNGYPVDAITRGNGTEGESVYDKIKHLIPMHLANGDEAFSGSIRGEVLMRKQVFMEKYAEKYANPRNLVSGILGDDDINDPRKMDIELQLYSVNGIYAINQIFKNLKSDKPETFVKAVQLKIKDLPIIYSTYKEIRPDFEYPTDGIVIQLAAVTDKFIGNDHEPYHMIAIKFPPKRAITTVKYVEFNLRKSGEFIPKLILEPVEVDGSTVSQCAAYNYGYVVEHKLYPGAKIEIGKSGDIIPYVQSVIEYGNEDFHFEDYPSGNSEMVTGKGKNLPLNSYVDGIHLYSSNFEESIKIKRERFISQCYSLEIKGFGWATFNNLFDMVEGKFIELFNPINLTSQMLEGYISGDKSKLKWIKAIENVKQNMTLYWLIGMQHIPGCSWSHAKQLARKSSGLSYDFSGLTKTVIESCSPGGENHKKIGEFITLFKQYGGKIAPEYPENQEYEATYEMTGEPNVSGYKTKADIVKRLNRWEHTSLKKGTTYLITDSKTSTTNKMSKAYKLGITILTYTEAIEMHNKNK